MLENSKIIIDIDSCTKCKACVNECNYYYFDSDILNLKDEMDKECRAHEIIEAAYQSSRENKVISFN